MKNFLRSLLYAALKIQVHFWRATNRDCDPRKWSNDEIRKVAGLFHGDVINVSAEDDSDKEGGKYRSYFSKANRYAVSNYQKREGDDYWIDLNISLENRSDLIEGFDVVFTHTVIEHIYEMQTAIKNLCAMSKDIVLTVVPLIQVMHFKKGIYSDYWRFTPHSLQKLFLAEGFKMLYVSWNEDPFGNIYLFHIASKRPELWQGKITIPAPRPVPGIMKANLLSDININDFMIEN